MGTVLIFDHVKGTVSKVKQTAESAAELKTPPSPAPSTVRTASVGAPPRRSE